MSRTLPGINIQWPWSELLLTGEKTIETRSYPIPKKYLGKELAVIETPGPNGKKMAGIEKARIVGIIVFNNSYLYRNKNHWEKEFDKHLVDGSDLLYGFNAKKEKWAWLVKSYRTLTKHKDAPNPKGIKFTSNCSI